MKTPMQELLEWVRVTLPMDLDTPRMIEQKIKSLLDKEKEVIMQALNDGKGMVLGTIKNTSLEQYYNETFKTKEK